MTIPASSSGDYPHCWCPAAPSASRSRATSSTIAWATSSGIQSGARQQPERHLPSNGRDYTARIFATPFQPEQNFLSGLGFGIGAQGGSVDGVALPAYKTVWPEHVLQLRVGGHFGGPQDQRVAAGILLPGAIRPAGGRHGDRGGLPEGNGSSDGTQGLRVSLLAGGGILMS